MHATTDRQAFAPPATPGLVRAMLLALMAHGLLVLALTWGVQWKHEAQVLSAEAELWAAVPEEAAPALQAPPEPVAPEPPPPVAKPAPEPEPVVKPPEVDIALEKEKQRQLKQKELQAKQAEAEKQAKLKAEKAKAEQLKADQLKAEQLKKDKLKQAQTEQAKKDALTKKATAQETKLLEAQRQANLQRMTGLAGASGGPNATGTALKSAGPSASYAGRIRARIKPNIVFTQEIIGNPTAEVEVRTSPDGTIVGKKLLKSSGDKAWDEAVLQAIEKTEVLPRDSDGRVPPVLEISFRPRD